MSGWMMKWLIERVHMIDWEYSVKTSFFNLNFCKELLRFVPFSIYWNLILKICLWGPIVSSLIILLLSSSCKCIRFMIWALVTKIHFCINIIIIYYYYCEYIRVEGLLFIMLWIIVKNVRNCYYPMELTST